jgi:hypothetical protein
MRGQGLARRVVQRALDDARAAGRHVVPRCWYVAQFIDDHDEYLDCLGPGPLLAIAELCLVGLWARTDGGYEILDRDLIERLSPARAPDRGVGREPPHLGPPPRLEQSQSPATPRPEPPAPNLPAHRSTP